MSCPQDCWPEPITRVQSLSESGLPFIPDKYVKPPSERPSSSSWTITMDGAEGEDNIPVIDLGGLEEIGRSDHHHNNDIDDDHDHDQILGTRNSRLIATMDQVSVACREWGFFQVVNHGISPDLMNRALEVWREFFHLPLEQKQIYANSPRTYEGYGSRLGIEKGAILDWNDYFYLHYLPRSLKDQNKWPSLPPSCREVIEEYSYEVVKLSGKLMKILSRNLGLEDGYLQKSFGGEEIGACMRVNFYPKCPQPDLTLGLSSHSDPGGMTLLLPDNSVPGLQVRKGDNWVTIQPAPNAFIVNIGDQIQMLSNAIYKSVEHRVIVNSAKERVSIAFFYNPRGDLVLEPAKDLVSRDRPALYEPMTFNEYRTYIRTRGPRGKSQVESLTSPR